MQRFLRTLLIVLFFVSAVGLFPGAAAEKCGTGVSPFITATDLSRVLFVVSGNMAENEIKGPAAAAIEADIRSALVKAGIRAEITTDENAINAGRFLKVHIYSILLERQVYYCSAAVMQRRPSPADACTVVDYSTITSQAAAIRTDIRGLIADILADVR